MLDSPAFGHLKPLYEGKEGYTLTSILLAVKRKIPTFTLIMAKMDTP
jgi:hypothetical protein